MAHVFASSTADASTRANVEPPSVEAAYRIASGGSLQAIRSAFDGIGRTASVQRTILASAVDLLGGHVSRGMHALQSELDGVPAGDRPYLVDLIAPLYVMLNRFDELHGLLDTVPAGHPVATAIAALRVVRDARSGRPVAVLSAINELSTYVDVGHDDLLVGKVAQRLALAAYYVKAYELATDLAEKSVHAYRRVMRHDWP